MKKLASILAVTLAAGVLATGCGSSSGSASKDSSSDSGKTVIKAATGANAKPYVYVGDDDKPAGYDVDVLNAVFDKLPDYELEYEVTDFGSVLSGLNSGNYQIGVNNFSYNEDRGASYLYSYPYDKISYVSGRCRSDHRTFWNRKIHIFKMCGQTGKTGNRNYND